MWLVFDDRRGHRVDGRQRLGHDRQDRELRRLDLGQSDFKFDGDFLFRQFGLIGLILTLAATLATTIGAVVFNLISDIIGGVWITVIEEETARPVAGLAAPTSSGSGSGPRRRSGL